MLAQLILSDARVDSDRAELILIRIVADLAEVVGTAGPKLTATIFTLVVDEEHRVVLAAGDLADVHVLEGVLDQGWFDHSVPVRVTKAQLALVCVTAAIDFVLIGDEDRVATPSLQVLDACTSECLLRDCLRSKHIFESSLLIEAHT